MQCREICIRVFFILFLLDIGICSCSTIDSEPLGDRPLTDEELIEQQGRTWLEVLCGEKFQGRRLGTEGGKQAFEYLWLEIVRLGYTPECLSFETEQGLVGRNIIVYIPGQIDSTIIVGGHFDGAKQSSGGAHYPAANDNASGAVAILLLLKSLKDSPIQTERGILCCLWDGEEVNEGKAFRGSRTYVSTILKSSLKLILHYENLDTIGHDHDNEIYVEYLGNGRIEKLAQNLSSNGRFTYHVTECSVFNSDYTPFCSVGIPIINYHDHQKACANPSHSVLDSPDAISISRLIKIVDNVRESIEDY